ncbi:hypothetical protein EVAR_3517_1 [Eumeta japonica]|uniref:Uncharacterized protein n=1 Tax=Eumeta variegata TaxID=151549 RepID=A0A4C1YYS3_EUMVA|nr:hypothetical protein EVAR_3517_1 [Eumeta japonica]
MNSIIGIRNKKQYRKQIWKWDWDLQLNQNWNLFKSRPSLESESSRTEIKMYYGSNGSYDKRNMSPEVVDQLSKSMSALEEATTSTKTDEYEVISVKPQLSPRPAIPRLEENLHNQLMSGLYSEEMRSRLLEKNFDCKRAVELASILVAAKRHASTTCALQPAAERTRRGRLRSVLRPAGPCGQHVSFQKLFM